MPVEDAAWFAGLVNGQHGLLAAALTANDRTFELPADVDQMLALVMDTLRPFLRDVHTLVVAAERGHGSLGELAAGVRSHYGTPA